MTSNSSIKVVLCWHMHQPQYLDFMSGAYSQPWTYLHAIKDYVDMAAHLEAHPAARAVINFAPILLSQIQDYASQVVEMLQHGGPIRDPLLSALADPALPVERWQQETLISACLRANRATMIDRFPHFRSLVDLASTFGQQPDALDYIDEQFIADLLVWYHLAWMGETVRRQHAKVAELMEKGRRYTLHDRRELLNIIGELLSGLIPRYRSLAENGQIELAVSPYAHPILPLLLDLRSAQETMPDAPMPAAAEYPDGPGRACWHIEHAIAVFREHFGTRPVGCWPSEGSVSEQTLTLLEKHGFKWCASGESVLHHSVEKSGESLEQKRRHYLYQPHRVGDGNISCFFRDDRLSNQIGFVYSDWHSDDAVADLLHHLENIAQSYSDLPDTVVSIILDGENAWEYYPENGYHFLTALYEKLIEHPDIQLCTFRDCLEAGVPSNRLPNLVPGSWVYGTFSTWIGVPDKNRGWDMLVEAKEAYDRAVVDGLAGERLDEARLQLAVCEGSDWFWWFGDDNPAEAVSDFDRLYRMHLSHLYQLIGIEPPEYLSRPFTFGGGEPALGGTMKR